MIITCPHCQTKYQVTFEAIGSAGRKVQCAHCQRAWDQRPAAPAPAPEDADRLFDDMAEDALDEIITGEERAVSAEKAATRPAPVPDEAKPAMPQPNAAEIRKRQAAFARRQNAMSSRLPLARLRRAARVTGTLLIIAIPLGAYFGRTQIVERFPDLAGAYAAVGLPINVVGLDFDELSTLKTLSSGNDVLMVSAQIVGLEPEPMPVPPVVISLLDASGHAVYEWSVSPKVSNLMAGERATFDTRLSLPPTEATRVRLSFAGGNAGQLPGQGSAPAAASSPAEAHDAPDTPSHGAPAQAGHGAPEHH